MLYHPMEEHAVVRIRHVIEACRSGNGESGDVIVEKILFLMDKDRIGSIIIDKHIIDVNTLCALEFGTPFCIEIQLLGNPETVTTIVTGSITIVGMLQIRNISYGLVTVASFRTTMLLLNTWVQAASEYQPIRV